jgi:glycosyltransferase involved in cell wall biosynthesis
MRILMLAPEPFFQARGTPISVYFRLKALSGLGHEVDLVTYPLGEDKNFQGLEIHRIPSLFFIKKIKVGPSFTKILLDFFLLCKAWRLLKSRPYNIIFSHEEAAWFGTALAKRKKIPHLYDMHSSLPQQLENFRFSHPKILKKIFSSLERYVLRNSKSVIVICPDLLQKLEREGVASKATLIENFLDFESSAPAEGQIEKERQKYATAMEKIILYTGNFEPYQGISLLIEAMAMLKEKPVVLLLVGGNPSHVEGMKKKAVELGISNRLFFTGQVPPSQVPMYIMAADALVSPRISGTNTPLNISSYLKSGKPVVATNLWTHTQILNDRISVLVEPEPESLADGILFALFDPQAIQIARAAKSLADEEFTYENYQKNVAHALEKAIYHQKKDINQQQISNP